jgi:FlaA1/EpsC-like NDP-sugar epimerase
MSNVAAIQASPIFEGKCVLLTGGTGSLGKIMTKTLLSGAWGVPRKIIVLSRDEAKQHFMRLDYEALNKASPGSGENALFNNFKRLLEFRIGDVRDFAAVCGAVRDTDIVINAAALKQVPACEYFPYEAVQTNIVGAQNVIRAVLEVGQHIGAVVGVSTDKACKPVNVMGMSKAMQERLFIAANLQSKGTKFVCVRYGNVLASRGSVIPLFHAQIEAGRNLTVTTAEMTRFLMPLSRAVHTVCTAIAHAHRGETIIPIAPAARMMDLARALIGNRPLKIDMVGIRPGEKLYEALISEEEAVRSRKLGDYYAIAPMLPELLDAPTGPAALDGEYNSNLGLLDLAGVSALLSEHQLHFGEVIREGHEILA